MAVSTKKFKCRVQGCGQDAKLVKLLVELVAVPFGTQGKVLKRKPPFGELMRTFLVDCPQHGQQVVQELGHHITATKKRSKKSSKKGK